MKYFTLENSINEKIMGNIPQTKEYIHHCDIWNDPNFIEKFYYRKIENKPILSNLILYSKANITDFIDAKSGIGFSNSSIVISNKFKSILEKFNCYELQFFQTYIVHKNKENHNYWQTHFGKLAYDYVDYEKSTFVIKEIINNEAYYTFLDIKNKEDFFKLKEEIVYPKWLYIKDIRYTENMDLDYFDIGNLMNGGNHGIVSERLKKAIEEEGITGIEFRPIELSLQNWYHSGEREKIYGKSY